MPDMSSKGSLIDSVAAPIVSRLVIHVSSIILITLSRLPTKDIDSKAETRINAFIRPMPHSPKLPMGSVLLSGKSVSIGYHE